MEPSVDFRRANTEPSVDFRKANMEPSVHFRRANTETYQKQNVNLSREGWGFPQADRTAPQDFPRALPLGNPSEQPCHPLENPVLPSSFTQINPIYLIVILYKAQKLCCPEHLNRCTTLIFSHHQIHSQVSPGKN